MDGIIEERDGGYGVRVGDSLLPLNPARHTPDVLKPYIGKPVVAGIRSEDIHLQATYAGQSKTAVLEVEVTLAELMGAEIYVYADGQGYSLVSRMPPHSQVRSGDKIEIVLDCDKLHLFDKETEQVII
ncbi:MAG: TOBE domain-containing protein [Oscillospiraceae bacterium]|nr:TOBE domain-containing protein [Oscillospiraceae bacterium]